MQIKMIDYRFNNLVPWLNLVSPNVFFCLFVLFLLDGVWACIILLRRIWKPFSNLLIWPHWLALSDENNTWTALIWMMTLIRASYSFIAELHLATLTQVLNWIDHWTGLSWIMKLLPFVELPIAKWNSFQRWISPCFWSELNDHWIKLSLIIHLSFRADLQVLYN